MEKTARGTSKTTTTMTSSTPTTTAMEEGIRWMADYAKSHHGEIISANPTEDYEFVVIGLWQKPLYR